MQTMARALTTAADPAQVADAVFAAMRDELRVDASTFALLDERGSLHTLRRFGYPPDDPTDGVLDSLQIDGPVLGHNVAFFAENVDDLQRDRPDIYSSLDAERFRALAIIPLVVSDRTIGAVVVHWDEDRQIAEPDRTFLFTITGAAAQAVERARLTLTEFVNLERSQHLHQLSSALAAATTPGTLPMRPSPVAGGRWAHSRRWCESLPRRAGPGLPGQQRPPGPPFPHDGAHRGQPRGSLLHVGRPSWPASPPMTSGRAPGDRDRGPGSARAAQAGDHRE